MSCLGVQLPHLVLLTVKLNLRKAHYSGEVVHQDRNGRTECSSICQQEAVMMCR
jgi:hypothetical protein